jgi:hypothetical protein
MLARPFLSPVAALVGRLGEATVDRGEKAMTDSTNGPAPPALKKRPRLRFTASLAGEIDKLMFETEAEAQSIVSREVAAVRAKKDVIMQKARDKIRQHVVTSLDGLNEDLDNLDAALGDNSGERPTSQD